MKTPQDKLRDFRRGSAKARRQAAMWKRYDAKPVARTKTVAVPVEPDEPVMDEAAELYSEYRLIIEAGSNGSVSCRMEN